MTELTLDELWQSAPAQALLLRHREASLREISREREPARLRLVEKIQEALALEKDQTK